MRIRATGNLAMFARPEMETDICSYDMITPSAARGLMESIFWHPGLKWVIDRIMVLKPIKFVDLGSREPMSIMALRDVDYIIEAHFDLTNAATPSDNSGKFAEMSKRRLQKQDFYKPPYFGSKEYPAQLSPYNSRCTETAYKGIKDLGYMLYDFDYSAPIPKPMFFRAVLKDGVLDLRNAPKTLK